MIDADVKGMLADRLEGWEIVEFLQLPVEDVIELFEDEILANLEDVLELAGIKGLNDKDDG